MTPTIQARRDGRLAVGCHDQEQEPTATCAGDLAAKGASPPGPLVPVVDLAGRDGAGETSLLDPGLVQDPAHLGDGGRVGEQGLELEGVLTNAAEGIPPFVAPKPLLGEHRPGVALMSGPEQHHVVEQRMDRRARDALVAP